MNRLASLAFSPNGLALAGVCFAGYGMYIIHPSLLFVSIGGLLVFLGVWKLKKESK